MEEVKKPVPGKGEALVRVMAAGICGSDIPRIFKTGAHNMPLIHCHKHYPFITNLFCNFFTVFSKNTDYDCSCRN